MKSKKVSTSYLYKFKKSDKEAIKFTESTLDGFRNKFYWTSMNFIKGFECVDYSIDSSLFYSVEHKNDTKRNHKKFIKSFKKYIKFCKKVYNDRIKNV